jgi:hypothetical protein
MGRWGKKQGKKAPNTKLQVPEKLQTPNSKSTKTQFFLELGI